MSNEWEPASGARLGPYELRSVLGRGGTSVVYRAVHADSGASCALKVLRQEYRMDANFRARLERESETLKRLSHPNILSMLYLGEHDGLLYVAMELVSGLSLRQLLQMRKLLPVPEACKKMISILSGLARAHQAEIVHRDLKPENILISEEGEIKLSDFGCAKGPGLASVTAEGVVLGTPTYMAPEHFQNRHIPLSDQYSAAVMLYEMLCGRVPFPETEPLALAMAHIGKKPAPPESHVEGLPPQLSAAVLKGLAKIPEQRHASLELFAAELEPFAAA